jgi:signal transduction histidine kinase
VSPEQGALLETPPDRAQIRVAFVVGFLMLASAVWVRFLGVVPLRELPAFLPVVDAIIFVSDLVTAILLFAHASVFRTPALMALASGYLLTALLTAAHALTFPGAFAPTGLLGAKVNTSAWLAVFWRAGFGLAICSYAGLKPKKSLHFKRPSFGIAAGVGSAFAIATALCMLATRGVDLLPALMVDQRGTWQYPDFIPVVVIAIGIAISAIAMLTRGPKSRLDVWLVLSISALFVQFPLILLASQRFTVAWYFAQAAGLASHLVIMLALISEAIRTYARLALTVSVRDRERDARLMSMDAVTAAIAHEVRQPLSAIVTNASAGLRWLNRAPPNLEMVEQSLRLNIEQGHRASDLINSMRSVLTKRSGERTAFSLNDLVTETAALMDRELIRENISLQLTLDQALPTIVADRLQMQQVLINLFTNAIQSLQATQGRARHIAIRSLPQEGQDVLLDLSDNGIGIAAERMDQIFDVFFTTKAKGNGMGLSLCRTIVEKHGGRLWASQGEEHGATFHLQLPRGQATPA